MLPLLVSNIADRYHLLLYIDYHWKKNLLTQKLLLLLVVVVVAIVVVVLVVGEGGMDLLSH